MTALALSKNAGRNARFVEGGVALAIVFVIALLVLPLPAFLLDLFLSLSIGLALVVLLVALYTTDPLEFSSFPSLLLLLTLFRLALNVSSTRLILSQGHAGRVIAVFGQFVIGGNYAVGLVLFLILVGINFIVITKGAGRVAEVAARFTLDAMPGKQMAIDADLGAGLIDEATARERRSVIARQADFYGAMDGASKFVKGDAIAGVLITGINIAGGIFIGVVQRGMPIGKAAATYTVLTVGEGLVTQIPALIVSTAAGLIVTHASTGTRLGNVLATQVGGQPRALYVAATTLGAFALVPGLPAVPFLGLAAVFAALARVASTQREQARVSAENEVAQTAEVPAPSSPLSDLLQLDPIELEVGYALIPLADESQGGDLLERVGLLRKQAALEFGVLIPAIRIRDDIRLPASEYVIKLRGSEIARAEVMPRHLLALDTGNVAGPIEGIETTDPSFGLPARWIAPSHRAEAEALGYAVVEATTMIATHLMETLKANAADLLGRQDVQEILDTIKRANPALVDELIPAKLSLGVLHRVLQRLLRERVPIRDLVTILEAIGDAADQTKDPEQLAEHARRALGHVLAKQHSDDAGVVRAITLGPKLEASLLGLFAPRGTNAPPSMLTPDALVALLRDLQKLSTSGPDGATTPLLVPPGLRIGVRRLVEPVMPGLPVLSLAELPPTVNVNTLATWEVNMRLETFRGRDLSTVCADVRAAFGDDAMIVETRANRDGRRSWIEVIAATPDDVHRLVRAFAPQAPLNQPKPRKSGGNGRPRIIALVGPTGAGKTTTVAKLAVHQSAFGAWRTGVITLDTFRAGAVEQLQAYADAADVPFAVAYDSHELATVMKRMADRDVILIDTPGRGPRLAGGRTVWRDLLTGLRPDETHLVVSATTRTDLAEHLRAEYASLSVTHTLLTKLDEVPHNATLAALASQLALPARWITDGQDVPTDLHGAGPAILGRLGFARATLTPT